MVKRFLIGLVFIFSSVMLNAQGGGGGLPPCPIPPCPGDPPPPNPVPITGIELLIGAGALFGAKRMIMNRQSKS